MRNIIITGGELFNKGAQAMTFITIDEMKKRFPHHNIFLLSELDKQRSQAEKAKYDFGFIGWYPIKFAKAQKNPILRLLCLLRNREELLEAEKIYKNTDLMIDISGYALGSNWSIAHCNAYLDHLEFAKAFNIPVYLMPQSFGPFDFQGDDGRRTEKRISQLLPYAKKICAREDDGYKALVQKYHLKNVIRTNDLVLNNRGINQSNIYNSPPEINLPEIIDGSTAVIPNKQNFGAAGSKKAMALYVAAVREMLGDSGAVYIISHSSQDIDICRDIKNNFAEDDRVILLEREFSCIEFGELVKCFKYIFASRFHAIVHAFKDGTPCVSLGWAKKYYELMQAFGQSSYVIDIRESVQEKDIVMTIGEMQRNYKEEKAAILDKLKEAQNKNVFDLLEI